MAKWNFGRCLDVTLKYEGGMSTDRRDPGNWTGGKVGKGELRGTKFGIAAASFPNVDIKNLTKAEAAAIYMSSYWNKLRGDDLPAGLDMVTFDYGVNSGVSRSAKELQRCVGTTPDGVIGSVTLDMAKRAPAVATIKRMCAARMSFLQGLKTWRTFGKGWSRRVADVEAVAVSMALSATLSPSSVSVAIDTEAVAARKISKDATAAAGGLGTGAVVGGGTGAVFSPERIWISLAVIVVLLAGAAAFSWIARKHKDRAEAYERAAVRV